MAPAPTSQRIRPPAGRPVVEPETRTLRERLISSSFDIGLNESAEAYLMRLANLSFLAGLQEVPQDLRSGTTAKPVWVPDGDSSQDKADAMVAVQVVQASGIVLSVGTVWWALRAGGLLAGLLGALPAWRHVDLLAVLPDDEEDDDWEPEGDAEAARDERGVGDMLAPTTDGERR